LEGKTLVSGETHHVIEATTPCSCGERRVKVSIDIG
jgi:hypothetical protein